MTERESIKPYINLIEIVKVPHPQYEQREWRVTFEYQVPHNPVLLKATFYVDPSEFSEEGILIIARHYLNGVCTRIGEDTADWRLSDEAFKALKLPTKSKP